jgi:transcription elongation factor GreA
MSKSRYELTREGYERFQEELDHLKTVKRKQNIEALQEARSQGDLSENAEYDAAREEQAQIEARINELENILKNFKLIEEDTTSSISIGKEVIFMELPNGPEEHYYIVGSEEADPFSGKISINSPIAQALIGKEVGDEATVTTPAGMIKVRILKVQQRRS